MSVDMKKWQDIFDERMAVFCTRFEQTNLWKFPRESLEAMWKAILFQTGFAWVIATIIGMFGPLMG